jgi:hypothetical protein
MHTLCSWQYVSNKLFSGSLTMHATVSSQNIRNLKLHSIPEQLVNKSRLSSKLARSSLSTPAISVGIFVAQVVA